VAGSNETAITGGGTHFSVLITALNYFGETAAGTATADTPLTSGNVVDLTWTAIPGAQQYNIYVSTNATAGTNAYLHVGTSVQSGTTYTGKQSSNAAGGVKYTLQGAVATSTNGTAPTSDSGTGGNNRLEGLIPTLSGLSCTGTGPYSQVGFESQNVWKGGYINQNVGTHLSTNAIFTALDGLWENNGMNNVTPGVYRADPSEIVADGGDLMRLANDILSQGAGLNYLLNISQDQLSGVRAGAAVAEFVNPVTRSTLKLTVHPWMSQGTALLMSYQLPQTWSHVDNAWEMTCVQDYVNLAPRQGDLPMGSALPGECRQSRQIPVTSDALRCVETVRAGSVSRTPLRGIAQRGPAERETVRSCGMVNRRRTAEMTVPLAA